MRGSTTDTTFKRLAPGFVVTEAGTKTFPWIKDFASQYSSTEEEMKRGVNAIVTNGETYVPMSGIRALGNGSVETGVDTLREMNNKPREGGDTAINQLIVMNTLKNLKPMYTGGEITPANYANGGMVGYENGGFLEGLQKLQSMQELYEGEGPRTESGALRFGPKGEETREGMAERFNFPLEEATFDTLYGEPGSSNMAIDIGIPSQNTVIDYVRSGGMPRKQEEFLGESSTFADVLRGQFPEESEALMTDIGLRRYGDAIEKVKSGWLDMGPIERMRSRTSKVDSGADQEPSREQLLRKLRLRK